MRQPDAGRWDDVAFGWHALDRILAVKARLTVKEGSRIPHYLMLVPGVLLVAILAYGLVLLGWRSFHSFDPLFHEQGGFSLENYQALWDDSSVRESVVRTVGTSLVASVVAVTCALPFAYTMARTSSSLVRLLLLVAVFFPFLTGDITRVYAWLVILGREGPISWVLTSLGFARLDVLGGLIAVGIAEVQIALPLCVMMLLPAFYRVHPELEQAAATMGAGAFARWRLVIVPLVKPGIFAAFALALAITMTAFAGPALLGLGVQDFAANKIHSIVLARDNQYVGAAFALVLLALVGTVVALVLGAARRSEAGTAGR